MNYNVFGSSWNKLYELRTLAVKEEIALKSAYFWQHIIIPVMNFASLRNSFRQLRVYYNCRIRPTDMFHTDINEPSVSKK